jgi:hypothetical protein
MYGGKGRWMQLFYLYNQAYLISAQIRSLFFENKGVNIIQDLKTLLAKGFYIEFTLIILNKLTSITY